MNLFYELGFYAVGIDQIYARVGDTKTTFDNHFEPKDDLVIAVIKQRDEWERQAFNQQI
ncbi:MAG: TetR/AcrR family transcriptional regulator [Planctomycetota bacterium]